MATIHLPNDFKEFLQLLNSEKVEYLLVGGYAVGCWGYSRATGDMDIWVAVETDNAVALVRVLQRFGFAAKSLSTEMFLTPNRVFRIGVAPLRIDLLTSAEGLDFNRCFSNRKVETLDGVDVNVLCLEDLKINKRALGRPKDQDDLEHLP